MKEQVTFGIPKHSLNLHIKLIHFYALQLNHRFFEAAVFLATKIFPVLFAAQKVLKMLERRHWKGT